MEQLYSNSDGVPISRVIYFTMCFQDVLQRIRSRWQKDWIGWSNRMFSIRKVCYHYVCTHNVFSYCSHILNISINKAKQRLSLTAADYIHWRLRARWGIQYPVILHPVQPCIFPPKCCPQLSWDATLLARILYFHDNSPKLVCVFIMSGQANESIPMIRKKASCGTTMSSDD